MLELPTIKTDFLFENAHDFNQTTHARPQYPIVFIHNTSLYFNCISSVKYIFKWSHHCHIISFSAVRPKWLNVPNQNIEYAYFERWEKCLCIVQNISFLLFYILKWQLLTKALKWIPKGHICKYFALPPKGEPTK